MKDAEFKQKLTLSRQVFGEGLVVVTSTQRIVDDLKVLRAGLRALNRELKKSNKPASKNQKEVIDKLVLSNEYFMKYVDLDIRRLNGEQLSEQVILRPLVKANEYSLVAGELILQKFPQHCSVIL